MKEKLEMPRMPLRILDKCPECNDILDEFDDYEKCNSCGYSFLHLLKPKRVIKISTDALGRYDHGM